MIKTAARLQYAERKVGVFFLFLDHADGGSRAFFDTDAATFAVIVVDLAPHGALVEMDGEVGTEFVAVEAEGTDAAVEAAFRR